ncbi:MAG: acyl transferase, partial [Sphingobacteriales bacterium]
MYINIEHIAGQQNWLSGIDNDNFEAYALDMFQYQYERCAVYHEFVDAIRRHPAEVHRLQDIPFLPISFFKTHTVTAAAGPFDVAFESSGTTSTQNSKHYVKDAGLYRESFLLAFEQFYGRPEDYVFLCLLPSYLERGNSSLVYMAD